MEAIEALLEGGADPRIYAEDHNTPAEASANDACVEALTNWDIENTEKLLKDFEKRDQDRLDQSKRRKQADIQTKENAIKELERELEIAQKTARKAYEELEKRITEHDTAVASGFERTDITINVINQAEMVSRKKFRFCQNFSMEIYSIFKELEVARVRADEVRVKLQMARLAARDEQEEDEELIGVKCNVKELDDVLGGVAKTFF